MNQRNVGLKAIFLLAIIFISVSSLQLHQKNNNKKHNYALDRHKFYALENAPIISLSESIKLLNECKQKCLTMKTTFPFSFKVNYFSFKVPSTYFETDYRNNKVCNRTMFFHCCKLVERLA